MKMSNQSSSATNPANAANASNANNSANTTGAADNKTFPMFFYGSLMVPSVLQLILNLRKEPKEQELRAATLANYAIKLWGPYPALVPRTNGKVNGIVFLVTLEQFAALVNYEGPTYTWTECEVEIKDTEGGAAQKKEVIKDCRVFVAVDPESNELEEGMWNLEAWKRDWL
jgi:gamma-glutamylcyclotransferase (GGCT)/AIG2-like uncharacterized protein YtfP